MNKHTYTGCPECRRVCVFFALHPFGVHRHAAPPDSCGFFILLRGHSIVIRTNTVCNIEKYVGFGIHHGFLFLPLPNIDNFKDTGCVVTKLRYRADI